MSEVNVTSGVAMREPPMAPEAPQKRMSVEDLEKDLQSSLDNTAKAKIDEVLKKKS